MVDGIHGIQSLNRGRRTYVRSREPLKNVNEFKYLCSWLTSNITCEKDIKSRKEQAWIGMSPDSSPSQSSFSTIFSLLSWHLVNHNQHKNASSKQLCWHIQ